MTTAPAPGAVDDDPDLASSSSSSSSLRTFVHAPILLPLLDTFSDQPDDARLDQIKAILDNYQNDPYLLEPHLARLSDGPLDAFKRVILSSLEDPDDTAHDSRLSPLSLHATYLYWLSKVVTPKILIRYFPHSVTDFSLLLSLIKTPSFSTYTWEARYIVLLWLALVINIPFSLEKFAGKNYEAPDILENNILQTWLAVPGKERDAAALFGAKYFNRRDIANAQRLLGFLQWTEQQLTKEHVNVFLATGILQFLNAFLQDCTRQTLTTEVQGRLYYITALYDSSAASTLTGSSNSPIIRRLRAKYMGRLASAYLPPPSLHSAATFARVQYIGSEEPPEGLSVRSADDNVPHEVDALLGDLVEALSDPDSRVRWTASKAIAKIAAQTPQIYVEQISETLCTLLEENVTNVGDADSEDLSLVSAATWHGVTLCSSALLRDNLLTSLQVLQLMKWIVRALTFTQRKGAQKVGTNVRDAACYFCWCLARAHSRRPQFVAQDEMQVIAEWLVVVACTDEETSVRRAASAAFQECAGRIPSITDGLDILLLIDGQVVGSRRNALLECAPAVAAKHSQYRQRLYLYILRNLLHHQQLITRILASKSLSLMLKQDLEDSRKLSQEQVANVETAKEVRELHGSLLLLHELIAHGVQIGNQSDILQALTRIPVKLLAGSALVTVLPTVALIVEACLCADGTTESAAPNIDHKAIWKAFVESASRRPESEAHHAAGKVVAAVSRRYDCLNELKGVLRKLKQSATPTSQQFATAVLGYFNFGSSSSCTELLHVTIDRLTKILDPKNTPAVKSIEAKCNSLASLARIDQAVCEGNEPDHRLVLEQLFAGLEDYTTDQAGEVGSRVRIVCLEALSDLLVPMSDPSTSTAESASLIDKFRDQLLRLACERQDSVRACAIRQLRRLQDPWFRYVDFHSLSSTVRTILPCLPSMQETSRRTVLSGIVTSVGHPRDMGFPATQSYIEWLHTLPVSSSDQTSHPMELLLGDLQCIIAAHTQSNRVLVPTLHTIAMTLEEAGEPTLLHGTLQHMAAMLERSTRIPAKVSAAQRLHATLQATSKTKHDSEKDVHPEEIPLHS